jgi:hypothetical protein
MNVWRFKTKHGDGRRFGLGISSSQGERHEESYLDFFNSSFHFIFEETVVMCTFFRCHGRLRCLTATQRFPGEENSRSNQYILAGIEKAILERIKNSINNHEGERGKKRSKGLKDRSIILEDGRKRKRGIRWYCINWLSYVSCICSSRENLRVSIIDFCSFSFTLSLSASFSASSAFRAFSAAFA